MAETTPNDLKVYDYEVVDITETDPITGDVTIIGEELIKTEVMTITQYENLVGYHTKKITQWEKKIDGLETDIIIAEEELTAAGEDLTLLSSIQSDIDRAILSKEKHEADLLLLTDNETAIKDKYTLKAEKKEEEKDKKPKEPKDPE